MTLYHLITNISILETIFTARGYLQHAVDFSSWRGPGLATNRLTRKAVDSVGDRNLSASSHRRGSRRSPQDRPAKHPANFVLRQLEGKSPDGFLARFAKKNPDLGTLSAVDEDFYLSGLFHGHDIRSFPASTSRNIQLSFYPGAHNKKFPEGGSLPEKWEIRRAPWSMYG